MNTRYLLILGAGATLSDAAKATLKKRPPLDRGFFSSAAKFGYNEFNTVQRYLRDTYDYSATDDRSDSLEAVMATVYADINNPELEKDAVAAFRALIRLFCRRLADSTNSLRVTNRFNLYSLIAKLLDDGVKPKEICIVTFNQDLQIEKVLEKLQSTNRSKKIGIIFDFPNCYTLRNAVDLLSNAPKTSPKFEHGPGTKHKIRILKLHGSLNWFSTHQSREVPKNAILNASRELRITPRRQITTDMTFRAKRRQYTFPIIIPPVTHKAGILHSSLIPIWRTAETALKHAHHIIVFGYSCPAMDFESANLIMRSVKSNTNLRSFNIIDPNPGVFLRYAELTSLHRIYYYRSMSDYLE